MLCDQDDVWLPNKIAITMQDVQEMEREHGSQAPITVNTGLTVVDESMAVIGEPLNKILDLKMQYDVQ